MLAVGETLQGRYRIVREIGAGGMGTVYEGENLLIRRRVAIKVMRGEAGENPELCARFEREAQIASQIPSDHITEVLDLGELESGVRFIVMEYLVGESLSARLERVQRLSPKELLPLVRQVLLALGAAHRAGVIHRDIKPDNVFIVGEKAGRSDFVKLLDFGISKIRIASGETPLTQNGMFVGTPAYMAPEQVGGGEASPLWDLYSVGVLLYRALTGEPPFKAQKLDELVYRVALGKFVPPSQRVAGLDAELDAIVCRAMARFPEGRFQSADQFVAALDAWTAEHTTNPALLSPPARASNTQTGLGVPAAPTPAPHSTHTAANAAAAALSAPIPTTRITTELGSAPKRYPSSWTAWAALGVLVAGAAALALWRASLSTRAEVEVLAAQPTLAAPPAATPTTPTSATPTSAAPTTATSSTPTSATATPSGATAAPADPASAATATVPTAPRPETRPVPTGSNPRRAAPRANAADRGAAGRTKGSVAAARETSHEPVLAAPPPEFGPETDPAPHDPGAKTRPDWGY